MAPSTPSSLASGFFQPLPTIPPQYSASASLHGFTQGPSNRSDDVILARILALYLPHSTTHISEHLHSFSRLVLHPSTLQHTVDADTNPPELHPLTTFGAENKVNPLRTSYGWRALKDIQTAAGVVGHGYEQPRSSSSSAAWNRRVHQFATIHLWSGSAAVATCPMAMTDGAAVLLRRHLLDPKLDSERRAVFAEAYRRLISLDPKEAWTSGQWMTERTGGSDVRGTETVARRLTPIELAEERRAGRDRDAIGMPLGEWRIDGFKWFSSATDANMAVLLAQTDSGLSAFYAPLRRQSGGPSHTTISTDHISQPTSPQLTGTEMNGITLSRLKSKLGTRAVPTAELEIRGMRAYLIGSEGDGIKQISSILNITRLHTASSGVACWARALAVSRSYSRVRRIKGGQLLADNAQHVRWQADETVRYRAATALYFFGVALLGVSEQGHDNEAALKTKAHTMGLIPRRREDVDTLMRMLIPVMKACCSLAAVHGLRASMESLGGVGYCLNNEDHGLLNVARLFADSNVNPIWEGTTSVMVEDVLRVIKDKKKNNDTTSATSGGEGDGGGGGVLDRVFGPWVQSILQLCREERLFVKEDCDAVWTRVTELQTMVDSTSSEELHWAGREVLAHIEAVVCACLLMADAMVDRDEVAVAVARRWVRFNVQHPQQQQQSPRRRQREVEGSWKDEVRMDKRIFLGDEAVENSRARL